jgi:PilZ domain-containing protein
VTFQPRSERVAIPGAVAELARTYAEVVNVSRTGALVRGLHRHAPGDEWPVLLELGRTPLLVLARVVRCEPLAAVAGRRAFALGLAFVNPSAEVVTLLERVCQDIAPPRKRRLSISLVRCCPRCGSRAVAKEANRQYLCTACLYRFRGFRVGFIRFAR